MEINPTTGSIEKTYIYANSQIIAQHDGDHTASRYFYLHDRLGSPPQAEQIINTSAGIVKYYTYEPFGETIEQGGTFDNPFQFTGQYFDSEIDEYYLRARQYNPHIARFTARDPVFGKFQEPLTLHIYLYCLNDPINRTDPTGERTKEEVLGATVIGAAIEAGLEAGFLWLAFRLTQQVVQQMEWYNVAVAFASAADDVGEDIGIWMVGGAGGVGGDPHKPGKDKFKGSKARRNIERLVKELGRKLEGRQKELFHREIQKRKLPGQDTLSPEELREIFDQIRKIYKP